ncbi:hypothetical protein [Anaerovorax sp. IOR16]|uniref:hypothetical protein n=1 Tax=Anaerovorax sp. IOR16 TaxID=2773458 RepID=UPI0019D2CA1D|nr:hypothetical protein [Anaerovorax sp. IOR16]
MNKKYKEIDFIIGNTIEQAVNELLYYKRQGILACGTFNGHVLYSDTVSMDSAYLEIIGKTKNQFELEQKERREKQEKAEQEFKEALPQYIENWKDKGRKILSEDKWEYWDKIVPIRANDLYHGMELDNTLDIICSLKENNFKEAKEKFDKQGHSGMSASLVFSMVREFYDDGDKFVEYMK